MKISLIPTLSFVVLVIPLTRLCSRVPKEVVELFYVMGKY